MIAPVGEKLLFEHTTFSATRGLVGDHPYHPPGSATALCRYRIFAKSIGYIGIFLDNTSPSGILVSGETLSSPPTVNHGNSKEKSTHQLTMVTAKGSLSTVNHGNSQGKPTHS